MKNFRPKGTLHHAIITVLREASKPLTTKEIAHRLNVSGLYTKKDRSPISPFQIHGRTKNYPEHFERDGSLVILRDSNFVSASNGGARPQAVDKAKKNDKNVAKLLFGDPRRVRHLKDNDFLLLGTIGQVMRDGLPLMPELNKSGIYSISTSGVYSPFFISQEETKNRKNVIRPWPEDKLREKWVNDSEIVYYGLAGHRSPRSLWSRLTDLIRHGNGKTSERGPHKGGEILWQLGGVENFRLWILPTEGPPIPRQLEKGILVRFRELAGMLPFANRQI